MTISLESYQSKDFVTKITDKIWLGSEEARLLVPFHLDVDYVISCVSHQNGLSNMPRINVVIPLADGPGNPQNVFNKGVNLLKNIIKSNRPVLVHCRMGISRSPTMLAAALAAANETSFTTELAEIKHKRTFVNPHPCLLQLASNYFSQQNT